MTTATPRVYTYHCTFCSHLLLASTHMLTSLPKRRAPGLDAATILPLPPPPKTTNDAPASDSDDDAPDTDSRRDKDSYTVLLTLTRDRAPKVVEREDGFEKRYLWRCGRCKLLIGYQLDESHYGMGGRSEVAAGTVVVGGGEGGGAKDRTRMERQREKNLKKGARRERGRVLYVLSNALTVTEELGRVVRDEDVGLVKGVEA